MKYSFSFFEIMMLIVLVSTNLMFLDISLTNMILSLGVAFIGFLGLLKKNIGVNPTYYLLFFATLLLIILTRQLNQISIFILILLYLFVIENKEHDYLSIYLNVSIFFFLAIIFAYVIFGFNIENDTTIWRAFTGQTHPRSSLGFYHSNVAMMKWLTIVMAVFAKVKPENVFKALFLVGIGTYFLYEITLSRTSTIVIFVISLLILLFRKNLDMEISKKLKAILIFLPILFMIVSLILVNMEDVEWFNAILSGRLTIYYNAWNTYGLTWFGSVEVENLMFDNAYLHMILSKGVLFTTVYFGTFFLIIKKSRIITRRTAILIVGFLLTAVMETILLKFEFLTLILILLYQEELVSLNKEKSDIEYQKELLSNGKFG